LDRTAPEWIHIFSIGKYDHPSYGELEFTPDRIRRFAENLNNKVGGIEPHVDFEHKRGPDGGRAAGWIKEAQARSDGLWARVEWNPRAKQEIEGGEWRFISADFFDESRPYVDPKTGNTYVDVVQAAALTNRPFLTDLVPLNFEDLPADVFPKGGGPTEYDPFEFSSDDYIELEGYVLPANVTLRDIPQSQRKEHPASDFAGPDNSFPIFKCEDVKAAWTRSHQAKGDVEAVRSKIISIAKRKGFTACIPQAVKDRMKLEEVNELDAKKLAEVLGMSEDTDEAKLLEAVTGLKSKPDTIDKSKVIELDELAFAIGQPTGINKVDLLDQATKLRPPEITRSRQFSRQFPEEFKQLQDERQRNVELELSTKLSEWHRGGEFGGLPTAVDDAVKEVRTALPPSKRVLFDSMIAKVLNVGLVPLSELPTDNEHHLATDEADAFILAVREVKLEHKDDKSFSHRDAIGEASRRHPELAEAYRRSTHLVSVEGKGD